MFRARISVLVLSVVLGLSISGVASDGESASSRAAPVVTSGPTASATPAIVAQPVTFTVAASDPDGGALGYGWNFGDGIVTGTTEPTVTHTYLVSGTYTVTVTIANASTAASASLALMVIDDGSVVALKKKFSLNFAKSSSDCLDITFFSVEHFLILDHAAFFGASASKPGAFYIGANLVDTFTIYSIGQGKSGEGWVAVGTGDRAYGKFKWSSKKGIIRYTVKKSKLQDFLAPFGATNTTTAGSISVPIYIEVDGKRYGNNYEFFYAAKQNKVGKGI